MTATDSPVTSISPLRGIALYVAAIFLFVTMDSLAKYLSASYPVPQIVWARYTFHGLLMVVFLAPRPGLGLLRTGRLALQVLRALFLLLATVCFFTAISYIPLAEAGAIGLVSPFIVVALSATLLKEQVPPRRWVAVATGFLGAMVILRPGLGVVHPAAFLVLVMAACFACYQISTRFLAFTERPLTTLFYTSLVGAVVMAAVVPFYWTTPDAIGWALMATVGTLGAVSHFILIKAFAFAPASTLAPFSYTQLVWATLIGFLVFADFPDLPTIAGAVIVVASGLYTLAGESRRHTVKPEGKA